jgi:hypothetical protein
MMKYTLPFLAAATLIACTPTVALQAPDKPIEINMNVQIDHRVRVEIEKDVQEAIRNNKEIF